VSSGETEAQARTSFTEALELHIEVIREDKQLSLPEPRSRLTVLFSEDDTYVTDYIVEIEPDEKDGAGLT